MNSERVSTLKPKGTCCLCEQISADLYECVQCDEIVCADCLDNDTEECICVECYQQNQDYMIARIDND